MTTISYDIYHDETALSLYIHSIFHKKRILNYLMPKIVTVFTFKCEKLRNSIFHRLKLLEAVSFGFVLFGFSAEAHDHNVLE